MVEKVVEKVEVLRYIPGMIVFWGGEYFDGDGYPTTVVDFSKLESEEEWVYWINQGFSPAMLIYYGSPRSPHGNIHSRLVEGWTLYRFGNSQHPNTYYA
jgi:hypothetical protein